MTSDLEPFLLAASFRYTKNVEPGGQTTFTIPFASRSVGVVHVKAFAGGSFVAAYTLVRTLDSIGVTTTRARLLTDLLKLNYEFCYARVHVWVSDSDPDGQEWVVVNSRLPADGLSEGCFLLAIRETANLAEMVHELIQTHTATQGVPGIRSP